ncbi:MAG: Ada metal-binding domain-containing protein [Candidatus Woesearchaeota archaeon]
MRSLKTLVGFVLILGLLTLGVVGLDYLAAPLALQLAFAVLLGAFGFIAFIIAIMSRPTAGTILASAAAIIALFVAVRDVFSTTLDLLLFALVIFDVIVLFVLFGEIDRFDRRSRRTPRPVREPARAKAAPAAKASAQPAQKAPSKAPARKSATRKAPRKTQAPAKRVTQFVASKKREGGSFHTINCSIARRIAQNERVYFATREEALKAGYKPCRVCNP